MVTGIRDRFALLWHKYFNQSELPITFFYSNNSGSAGQARAGGTFRCLIGALSSVREGQPLAFDAESIGCPGGRRYAGFTQEVMPNFEYFLSCGLPGRLEGERYKKTPELVKEAMAHAPDFAAPARFIVFKRWDLLEEPDNPEVVVFFAPPDVLSGLFTLANFDEAEQNGVITPFGSGCSSIVQYPYLEGKSARPRAIIGMFDVSARPYVPRDELTFAVPTKKFSRMIENMDESFLITNSWRKIQERIP
jgi:uncharacterized protein (DUF169 family)